MQKDPALETRRGHPINMTSPQRTFRCCKGSLLRNGIVNSLGFQKDDCRTRHVVCFSQLYRAVAIGLSQPSIASRLIETTGKEWPYVQILPNLALSVRRLHP